MNDQRAPHDLLTAFAKLGFITCSPNMVDLLHRAWRAADVSDITVLLEGETGTGKQVLARSIHQLDQKRCRFPFVTVHCSTISEALAESELFGHHRGAFSGAVADRRGLFQSAQRGTLFLDDINDLPFHLQPKLLDVIQRGIIRPVGSDQESSVDVRIIAACNQPLEPLVREKRFRSDLYHRLNVVKLTLPPLRERAGDLKQLVLALAKRYGRLYEPIVDVEQNLLAFLESRQFLGNVRELENAVQRMLFLKAEGSSLDMADWLAQAAPENPSGKEVDPFADVACALWKVISQSGISFTQAFQEMEKRVLEAAINIQGSTRREIAQRLRTSERTLYYKMRAHGLNHPAS
ncbi:MAG TPA: sigma 54-interacting transcriptional regulator [Candidatus Angelobacter sp.]|nr:sigma 54-interacting transcriptional regulator [Candidatus Angelobacter sp.]